MPGETEEKPSGWTTDTLRSALKDEMELVRSLIRSEIDSLRKVNTTELDQLRKQLDERYVTQSKAMEAAFLAADKAVRAALDSTEKAVIKAEIATDKRFESVNEFRANLADQATLFMPRSESTARWQALSEKLDTHTAAADERFSRIELRIEGIVSGARGGIDHSQRTIAIIGAVAGVAAIIGVLITLFAVLSR